MNAILQGRLAHFPPAELLTLFSSFGHTGTLEVVGEGRNAQVVFRDGALVYAWASDAAGSVDETVCSIFTWPDAAFSFFGEMAMPVDAQPVEIDIPKVIAEGTRRAAERKALLEIFPTESIGLCVVENPPAAGEIKLTGEEFRVLIAIGRGITVGRLRAELQQTQESLYPLLSRLETAGLIRRTDPVVTVDPDATTTPRSVPASDVPTLVNADIMTQRAVTVPPADAALHVRTPEAQPEAAVETPASAAESAADATAVVAAAPPALIGSLTTTDGGLFPLLDPRCVVGRDPSSEVPINDSSISAQHARIVRGDSGFVIEDLQSRNGTYVNGERISEPRVLADRDMVRLGKVVLTFNVAAPVPPAMLTE